jgi:pilus assembly protein Flp/PilA
MPLAGKVRAFARNEDGATMIEYALVASLISMALVGGLSAVTPELVAGFERVIAGFAGV